MSEPILETPATVPPQRESTPPVRRSMPVIIALVVIVALIGIANISSLISGKKKTAAVSALPMRPASANPQQVSSFESQQQMQAQQDADNRQRQQEIAAAMQQLQSSQDTPGPEAAGTPAMTAAQRAAIYGDSPNAPAHTSNVSQAQAEAKQKALDREKQRQDALNSDTVAIDFAHPSSSTVTASAGTAVLGQKDELATKATSEVPGSGSAPGQAAAPPTSCQASSTPSSRYL